MQIIFVLRYDDDYDVLREDYVRTNLTLDAPDREECKGVIIPRYQSYLPCFAKQQRDTTTLQNCSQVNC